MIRHNLVEIFEKIAPGTPLREGIFNILDGHLGALLILGYDEEVEKVLDGGFFIDCDYTPERLFELAKMDGAIVLDKNCEKLFMRMFIYKRMQNTLLQKAEPDIEQPIELLNN